MPSRETLAAQAGHFIDRDTGAVVPPIHPSTTYARDAAYRLPAAHEYTRALLAATPRFDRPAELLQPIPPRLTWQLAEETRALDVAEQRVRA